MIEYYSSSTSGSC